ncbi:VOC family protein [Marisediminicola senii]|uniref:VOC family protein n=1 Tax=Marisediminicola senii TaxID=2711233 RepID=UPI0013EB526F|nr:VOC family protein [Marisediminicola senii]
MTVTLNPYLNFRDTAKDALAFYQSVLGGEVTTSTFADYQVSDDPAERDKIMHGMLAAGDLVLMAADTPNAMELTPGTNFSVSLSGSDEDELHAHWNKLAEGGIVTLPLEKAPWGDSFGMVIDKFGVNWMVNIAGSAS